MHFVQMYKESSNICIIHMDLNWSITDRLLCLLESVCLGWKVLGYPIPLKGNRKLVSMAEILPLRG